MVALVRQAIFTALDEREWKFTDDEQRVDFADRVATFIPNNATASETQEHLCVLVPDSWLDPLLTGPDAVLKGPGPWGCAEIEALLKAVRTRIRKAEHAARR